MPIIQFIWNLLQPFIGFILDLLTKLGINLPF